MKEKKYQNKDWLYQEYVVKERTSRDLAKECDVDKAIILRNLEKFNIPKRYGTAAYIGKKVEFKNYDWLYEQYISKKLSAKKIAKSIDVNKSTILDWLEEFNIETREIIGDNHPLYKVSPIWRMGENCNFWRGGITKLHQHIRMSLQYKNWRRSVYLKNGFICVECKSNQNLNADHIKPFALICCENNIKTIEEAENCQELWDINNGRILCEKCHNKTNTFGGGTKKIINDYNQGKIK